MSSTFSTESTPPDPSQGSAGTKLRIGLIIVIVAGLAGWGVFVGISGRSGYAEAVKQFEDAAVKFAGEEVRLSPTDATYHRKFHRSDEGRLGTLPEAARLGYERCNTCSPPVMPPLPRRPLAWLGGVGIFVLVALGLVIFNARTLGLEGFIDDEADGPDAPPPSHFADLSFQFTFLQTRSDELLQYLLGPGGPEARASQATALAMAVLRWAARWTQREVSVQEDIELLELEAAPSDAPAPVLAGEGRQEPGGPSRRAHWLEQQYEYRQLLWKAVEESTAKIQPDIAKRLLDHLIRDAQPEDLEQRLIYDEEILNHLSGIMAQTVRFFRKHYVSDSRLQIRKSAKAKI